MQHYDIALYFAGDIKSFYQIQQWQKPLEALHKTHPVLFVVTDYEVYYTLRHALDFDTLYIQDFSHLIHFYDDNELAVILYINNSLKNFQSLRYSRGYHIHLNHGESEKESMRSNQSQGYDFVFTVGQRGIERYQEYLLNFNPEKYLAVGRPQLDFIEPISLPKKPQQRIILYAPTWEATHPSMNYSSVPHCGLALVETLLQDPDNIVIYKPHSALGTRSNEIAAIHQQIRTMVEQAENGHDMEQQDINSVFTQVDFAFFDNSSVMVDYLHTQKPAAYIEVLEDQSINLLASAFTSIAHQEVSEFARKLEQYITSDPLKTQREQIREHYLGNYKDGESTALFIQQLGQLIEKRQQLAPQLKR